MAQSQEKLARFLKLYKAWSHELKAHPKMAMQLTLARRMPQSRVSPGEVRVPCKGHGG